MDLNSIDYQNILSSEIIGKIITFFLIVSIGFIIGKVIGKIVFKILHEISLNRLIKKTTKLNISFEQGISKFITYFIYFATLIMALTNVGVTTTVLNIIITAIVIIIIIALFFVIKSSFPNIIAGIILQKNNILNEGDIVDIDDKKGKIINISLVETTIQTSDNATIFMPNSVLLNNKIIKKGGKHGKTKKTK